MEKRTFVERTSRGKDTGRALEDKVDFLTGQGVPHPVSRAAEDMRKVMLSFGFDEVEISYLIPEEVLFRAYSDLFPVYQDITYYLGWLKHRMMELEEERPEELTDEEWECLKDIVKDVVDENLSLEEGVYRTMEELKVDFRGALRTLLEIWEQVRGEVVPERLTLRSSMPAAWLPTLRALSSEDVFPLKLFTISKVFRREHLMEETHGRVFTLLSAVIEDPEIDLDAGLTVVRSVLEKLGVKDVEFRYKHYSPPYYQPAMEYELFLRGYEVGTCGVFSEEVLRSAGVPNPVFHLEIGVERLLMAREGYPGVKELEFPQFYRKWKLKDEEVAEGIKPVVSPRSEWGRGVAQLLYEAFMKAREDGKVREKVISERLTVRGEEIHPSEEGRLKLTVFIGGLLKDEILGPAAGDRILVHEGNILGVPSREVKSYLKRGAVLTDYDYVRPLCLLAASHIESWLKEEREGKGEVTVERVRSLQDVNLTLLPHVKEYVLSRSRKIEVQGPLFFRVGYRGVVNE